MSPGTSPPPDGTLEPMDIGQQFEALGIHTGGFAESRGIDDYNPETNRRDPDTIDKRRSRHESNAARYGGSGDEYKSTEGFREPHSADWMQWHVQAGYGARPKVSWN